MRLRGVEAPVDSIWGLIPVPEVGLGNRRAELARSYHLGKSTISRL
jgi:hypothetical protein